MLAPLARGLLRLLPERAAFGLTVRLAQTAFRAPLKARDREALARAQPLRWGPRERFHAWKWGATGPSVILIHGWGGRAAQMAPLAEYLAARGFQCVAPDMRAHGESPGWQIRFRDFIDDLPWLLETTDGIPAALIGHSAGAMTMMAARHIHGLSARHYVSLNGPRAPYPPIEQIDEQLSPSPAVLHRCEKYFAGQFGESFEALQDGHLYRYLNQGRLLAIHDQDDPQVRASDAAIVTAGWPDACSHRTRGLGHQRVLYSDEVHARVHGFLTEPAA